MSTGQTQHQKKSLFLLRAGRDCLLTSTEAGFNSILVYSFLVYRLKMAKGDQNTGAVTRMQIERGTGLSRSRTIPKAIEILEAQGLLGRANGRVYAHQGQSGDWFVQMKNSQHKPWYARIAYLNIWIPSSDPDSLTPRHNAVYWLVRSKPNQRQVYYAIRLGIDEKTVARAIERLRRLELISWSGIEPLQLQARHLALWQDKPKKKFKTKEFRLSDNPMMRAYATASPLTWFSGTDETAPSQQFAQRLDGYGNRMRSAGYSTVEITTYWERTAKRIMDNTQAMEPFERFVIDFGRVFDHVEAVTQRNRAAGTFNGPNSLGLLETVTRQATEELQLVWQNHLTYGSFFAWSWSVEA
jgi:hypothetical protein